SFEDREVAALLNASFVCVKVDREERPDVDQVYMAVTQAMTGSGGWPMTVILTPDRKPFFAGTDIPWEPARETVGVAGEAIQRREWPQFEVNPDVTPRLPLRRAARTDE